MKILIIAGGSSSERDVSVRGGKAVAQALTTAGHTTEVYDPADSSMSLQVAAENCDIAFPVLHGAGGEDGVIQKQLERLSIPYVGSDVDSSELCFDKWNYRDMLATHGLPVARGELVDVSTYTTSELTKQPFVLKPPKGGSSIDTYIVRHLSELPDHIDDVFASHNQMLLEQLIEGIEITVGVLDGTALPIIEIIPPEGGEFDYENKYNGTTQELCPPQHINEDIQHTAQELAVKIHELTGCRHLSRTDMIVQPDGSLIVLETNTIPGMTDQSLFPKAAATAGITMPELCDKLARMAAT